MPSPKSAPRLSPKQSTLVFEAIGTQWKIELDFVPKKRLTKLSKLIADRIADFDKAYSRFRDDSLVSAMALNAGEYRLPDDAEPLIELYNKLHKITDGLMTPTIGTVLAAAGYNADYRLTPEALTQPPDWSAIAAYKHPFLNLSQPALLDFGAAGKGYLVDIIAELLEQTEGIGQICINAGGDVVCRGPEPTRIALEHPEHPALAIGIATIENASLCGSAGNRRTWDNFHHVIDPKKLVSPNHIKALWVVAETGLLADGLSTALYFVEPKELAKHFDFEYAIVNEDMSLNYSPNFPAEFF